MKYTPTLNIVLYEPKIPQNTGAIGRTCVAVGAKLWLVGPLGFQVDEKARRRAGLDYWEHLEWEVVDDWASLLTRLPATEPWLFSKTARKNYLDVSYTSGDVLVFGSETEGLPRVMLDEHADRTLRIPIRPQVRSLNLSCAVSVVAFEALRQWQANGKLPNDMETRSVSEGP